MSWQELEIEIRKLAESVWGSNAIPEVEAGVKCDCIIRHRPDYWVLVEISKSNTLEKLRQDLAKFAVLKPTLVARGIYCESYFVTSGDHSSLVETGKGLNVEVHTPKTFANKFLGSNIYVNERSRLPFGSAVNPDSGRKDDTYYTPMKYVGDDGHLYTVSDICDRLSEGKKIVLVGEFGTGKSRCLMEAFANLTAKESSFAPIAINLRDNWGYGSFKGAFTVSRISELGLSPSHKTLLAIIKKLFFQPGRGRQADALLRGAESYWDDKAADSVLHYMLREDIIAKVAGSHGDLYLPRRRNTRRMAKIWELQSNSGDDLWTMLGT